MTSCSCRLRWSSPGLVRVRSGWPSPLRVTPVTSPATSQVPKEAVRFTWGWGLENTGLGLRPSCLPGLGSLGSLQHPQCPPGLPSLVSSYLVKLLTRSCLQAQPWEEGEAVRITASLHFLFSPSSHTAHTFSPSLFVEATAGHMLGPQPRVTDFLLLPIKAIALYGLGPRDHDLSPGPEPRQVLN